VSRAPTIRAATPGDQPIVERILRALPDWFGIEESLVQYVRDSAAMETWIAESGGEGAVGFITLNNHFPRASEIHCIAVLREQHRAGIGRALVEHAPRAGRRVPASQDPRTVTPV
jgi:N-acetylglutamate synthase-like GNAT family acetyltransferase